MRFQVHKSVVRSGALSRERFERTPFDLIRTIFLSKKLEVGASAEMAIWQSTGEECTDAVHIEERTRDSVDADDKLAAAGPPEPGNGQAAAEDHAPITAVHRLLPMSAGTALPVCLVRHSFVDVTSCSSSTERIGTFRAAFLASQTWCALTRPYLHAVLDSHLEDGAARPARLPRAMLQNRHLSRCVAQLTLNIRGASPTTSWPQRACTAILCE